MSHTRRRETRASAGTSRKRDRPPGRVAVASSHDLRGRRIGVTSWVARATAGGVGPGNGCYGDRCVATSANLPQKPPTPPRVAPVAGTGRARLGWGPTAGYAALAADRTGGTGRAAGGRGSRLTDHRHGGASASHAGRGHRGSRPPTHRPRRETDSGGRARERGPRRAGPVADGAATVKETPASPLRSACSSASQRPLRGLFSSADQPESRPADRRLDPRWSRGTACQTVGVPTCFLHDCRRTAARNLIRAGWRPAPGGVRSAIR